LTNVIDSLGARFSPSARPAQFQRPAPFFEVVGTAQDVTQVLEVAAFRYRFRFRKCDAGLMRAVPVDRPIFPK
jgi:hypothetical protein